MNNKFLITILSVVILLPLASHGQEKLVSNGQNPSDPGKMARLKSGVLLTLPFIDDFSETLIYPSQEKWSDNMAYINNDYASGQPGYGVATLDMIDSLGRIYENASVTTFRADFLTSNPIDLNIGADSTVYLSFYYQPQGIGDAPEPDDSLVLEFYSPGSNRWHWAWSTPGSSSRDFRQVLVNIDGAAYLQEGFRFRFVNYASLADAYEPSLKVNADHWHIDYVYLDRGRNYQDTIIPDLSLIDPVGTLLLDYSSMPWEHFKTVGISAVKALFPITIQNLSSSRLYYTPLFRIEEEGGTGQPYEVTLQPEEIRAFNRLIYEAPFNYAFDAESQDSASFTISLDLQPTENDIIPGNTKLESKQEFKNYYAYDDGTAEAGYGLVGEGANNGRVAYRFENLVTADSLTGVQMFFNKSFDNANHKYFYLAIWNEIDDKPGDLLYRMSGLRSGFNKGLTGFDTFMLDTAQLVPSVFYIGWIQVTNDFLNVGFDRNTDNRDNIFYTLKGDWKNTAFEGSLMIRPVFANKSKKTGINQIKIPAEVEKIKVYPNPASTYINVEYPDNWIEAGMQVIDIHGRVVAAENQISSHISLPDLDPGTYFIIFRNKNGETSHHKILINNE
jgi:hypothetical protein